MFKFSQIFLNSIKFYFWKILKNFLNFCGNFFKIFWNFSKFFDEYIFAECFQITEILATPLQYKTWKEFMYEILFDVPPRTKILALPLLSHPNIRVQETPWNNTNDYECLILKRYTLYSIQYQNKSPNHFPPNLFTCKFGSDPQMYITPKCLIFTVFNLVLLTSKVNIIGITVQNFKQWATWQKQFLWKHQI